MPLLLLFPAVVLVANGGSGNDDDTPLEVLWLKDNTITDSSPATIATKNSKDLHQKYTREQNAERRTNVVIVSILSYYYYVHSLLAWYNAMALLCMYYTSVFFYSDVREWFDWFWFWSYFLTVYLFWNKVSKNNRNHHIILLFFVSQNTQMTHIQIDFNYASLQFLHDDTSQTTR